MNSKDRRYYIDNLLNELNDPIKGGELAEKLNVTRQIIVKDIAILRAAGSNIIATPEGYMIPKKDNNKIKKMMVFNHTTNDIEKELRIIIKYGGLVKDVIVEHHLYGEIKAMLMIKNLYDVQNFINKFKTNKIEPLLVLTGGIHIHTIETESEENMNKIIEELKVEKLLVID